MRKKRRVHAVEYALLVILIGIIALVAYGLSSSNDEAAATPDVPENALSVDTYVIDNTRSIVRWEDPNYDVVCWALRNGFKDGSISCVPKSEIEPPGSTK